MGVKITTVPVASSPVGSKVIVATAVDGQPAVSVMEGFTPPVKGVVAGVSVRAALPGRPLMPGVMTCVPVAPTYGRAPGAVVGPAEDGNNGSSTTTVPRPPDAVGASVMV